MMKKRNVQGFTITEVLVALILIAIIFTLAMGTLTKGLAARTKSEARLYLAAAEKSFIDDFTASPTNFNTNVLGTADYVDGSIYYFYYSENYTQEEARTTDDYITLQFVTGDNYFALYVQGYRDGNMFGESLSRKVAS